eukprot:TRINITY_DN5806_c0_g5_i1.p2 TRINITY_DN5806_c0_g5~~TRINITY_DN5806_c0_g5_i1.p2  ORF type:complete len:335 (+),score=114.97 TRINITY_DN5806_c0_g5_i1:78-1082(+)
MDGAREEEAQEGWHMWAGKDMYHAGKQVTSYTKGVSTSHAQQDLAEMRKLLDSAEATREERLKYLTELDHKWAFKLMEHKAVLHNALVERREEWEKTEDVMFMASSDDSDGVDPDFEEEWGDHTPAVYSACRRLEANPTSEEAVEEFTVLLEKLADVPLTLTESQLIWDAVRMTYRQTEAVHGKRWLTGCTELVDGKAFANRPTLACFHTVASAAAAFPALTERQRSKASRWADKSMTIFHKRVAILKEFGVAMPNWDQVRVSSPSRPTPVPTVPIYTAIAGVGDLPDGSEAAALEDGASQPPTPTGQGRAICTRHSHFPCNGAPAMPHPQAPE